MSRTSRRAGTKKLANRVAAHLARRRELQERKRLRRERREINERREIERCERLAADEYVEAERLKQRAEIEALLQHCAAKSKTRKRSVEKLMNERGWYRVSDDGTLERQWERR